jgi:hypothetical protein
MASSPLSSAVVRDARRPTCRFIGVVQLDCLDDEAAIKSAGRLVDSHDVELWQMDRPIARFDAQSRQMRRK